MTSEQWNTYVKQPVAADGAWGTELLKAGLEQGDSPELMNLDSPDVVKSVAASYAEAGSRIILTNSFGGSSIKLAQYGLEEKADLINKEAARLTAAASGKSYLTAGDMGPCGKMVFMGEVSEDEVEESFARQAAALKEGGADILLLETFTDLIEVSAALKGAVTSGLPVAVTLTYDRMADGSFRTIMGHSPQDVIPVLTELGAAAVGANCGAGIDQYVALADIICQNTSLPVWIKANAGLPILENNKVVYPMGAEEYATHVPALLKAGVRIVGGCCGTNPDHIQGIVREIGTFLS
ncbi:MULTISPECIES: homocysteine S-methyltransferase family protein [unclassified Oceanispirochaeta]|uniref:homocysteine S-methyltransferase family protein n=1 Tax=unclassified Oceanispirochaeta TaxID=2635722 RepID=UPI000E08DE66|nr:MULTISPECIES: homocysteine S-methyltransferase family protein [unclassified Oceanispirochaeta]MBF9017318.1 homocysteine S-methyltransferase family protein [Oceanispirochaeta sp. M2]NPD73828.1 homocysteine S-methyltransferase family protein [Oceanispirochaeta sp. M1]RDG30428.1 methionine synthase [Oceanispirochaeta sp. M1]